MTTSAAHASPAHQHKVDAAVGGGSTLASALALAQPVAAPPRPAASIRSSRGGTESVPPARFPGSGSRRRRPCAPRVSRVLAPPSRSAVLRRREPPDFDGAVAPVRRHRARLTPRAPRVGGHGWRAERVRGKARTASAALLAALGAPCVSGAAPVRLRGIRLGGASRPPGLRAPPHLRGALHAVCLGGLGTGAARRGSGPAP